MQTMRELAEELLHKHKGQIVHEISAEKRQQNMTFNNRDAHTIA